MGAETLVAYLQMFSLWQLFVMPNIEQFDVVLLKHIFTFLWAMHLGPYIPASHFPSPPLLDVWHINIEVNSMLSTRLNYKSHVVSAGPV